MTPSEAHDSAWKRDAGHDEMVIGCLNYLKDGSPHCTVRRFKDSEPEICSFRRAESEAYLKYKGKNHGFFADILFCWSGPSDVFRVLQMYEIKPKIYSCGALIRQLKVQDSNLEAVFGDTSSILRLPTIPIIKVDDPLFFLLQKMIVNRPIATWDGTGVTFWRRKDN